MFVDAETSVPLLGGLSDNPFLGIAVWNVVLHAELIEQVAATNAKFGFQGVRRVVKTSVDNLIVFEKEYQLGLILGAGRCSLRNCGC